MNHAQVVDHESKMLQKFRQEGKRLAHICMDWDGLAIHADSDEIIACCCDFETEDDNILRDECSEKRRANTEPEIPPVDFSPDGAPAHSGTNVEPTRDELCKALRMSVEFISGHRTGNPLEYCKEVLERSLK